MSRIGKKPITIPNGVEVQVKDHMVTVKGPKGTLTKSFLDNVDIKVENSEVIVTRDSDEHKNIHGLTRALINNMVKGVTEGYSKTLEINGVGYKVEKKGNKIVLSLGYSHPVEVEEVEGITFETPNANTIIVKGINKELVGQIASNIREKRPPEPYKGKGIKYADEKIRRKEGKTGTKK